jgi:ABC-type Fe3+-hydroxamate transport system substrate-binding protein
MTSHPLSPGSIADARGSSFTRGAPGRIVSLVPSLTETLFALGAGHRVVGRTDWCTAPRGLVDPIPTVGGTKTVDVGAVVALAPDLVLANQEENTREVVEALSARVPVFVTYPRTVAEAGAMCRDLAALIGAPDRGDLARAIERALEGVRPRSRAVRTATLIWWRPLMAAGDDTYLSDCLAVFGCPNVFRGTSGRYPEITMPELIDAGPELLVLPDEPFRFLDAHAQRLRQNFTDRGHKPPRTLVFDGSLVTWFGARTVRALHELGPLLDRALTGDPAPDRSR